MDLVLMSETSLQTGCS